ncbi:MAG: bifunctional nuclease domain-containing protein [Bacteroidales bacterium]
MKKVALKVVGISYSQTQSGAYALILGDEQERRIPIIVGAFEAQAIAIQLEGLHPPRPLTHDLFHHMALAFGIHVTEAFIYKLEEGVFFARLVCTNENRTPVALECRTSDAVALALHFDAPIYATEEILQKAGISLHDASEPPADAPDDAPEEMAEELSESDLHFLERRLSDAVEREDYEEASRLRDAIRRIKGLPDA